MSHKKNAEDLYFCLDHHFALDEIRTAPQAVFLFLTVGAGRQADPGLPVAGGKQAGKKGFHRNCPDSEFHRRLAAILQDSNYPLGPSEGLREGGEQVSF